MKQGRTVTFGRVSPVVLGEVSEAVGSSDLRTGPQRVGSGRSVCAPA